jgi:hypothetical protein
MLNPKLIEIFLVGKKYNESNSEFLSRIRLATTEGILTVQDISSSETDISSGIDVNVPVVVQDPIVTEATINQVIALHNQEIQKMQAINQKIIEGVIALITAGATVGTGGGYMALLPLITELLAFLQTSNQQGA